MQAEDTMEADPAEDMHDGTDKSIDNPFSALPPRYHGAHHESFAETRSFREL